DVPLERLYPASLSGSTEAARAPHASTSGLRRPSAEGPSELKPRMLPSLLTAPTVITCRASAGTPPRWPIAGLVSCPPLPAAVQQKTPLAVAILTAIVHTPVWPLNWA